MAAAAARHAALGASRPQGRAAVAARESGKTSLTGAGDRHRHRHRRHALPGRLGDDGAQPAPADIRLIVHPLLTVHRDVAGVAHGTVQPNIGAEPTAGRGPASPGSTSSSSDVGDPARLAADLRRVLDDLRVAMEDQRRMRSAARDLVAGSPTSATRRRRRPASCSPGCRPATSLFLGYREYDLAGDGDEPGAAAGSRHRPRHPPPRRGRLVRRHARPDEHGGGDAKRLRPLVLAKSSHEVHRLPAQLPGLRGGPHVRSGDGEVDRRVPVPRPVHAVRLHRVGHPHPGAAPQARPDARGGRAARGQPRRQGPDRDPRGLPARGAVRDQRGAAGPDSAGRARAWASASRCGCSCAPTPTAATCPAWCTCPGTGTPRRSGCALPGDPAPRASAASSVDYSAMVGNSALARLHVVVHGRAWPPAGHGRPAALQAEIAAAVRSWDEDLAAEAERQLGAERAVDRGERLRRRDP